VRPDDLAAHVVRSLVDRSPDLDPATIDDVLFGDANGAGEDNRDVARMAVLLAGLPTSVPGSTTNRLCGSGIDAAIQASRAIETGDASIIIAGGVESMSRAPYVMLKPDKPFPGANETLVSTHIGWRFTNPKMPKEWSISNGQSAELLAEKYGITREAQDAFALQSHQRAAAAWAAGTFTDEIVPVPGVDVAIDESIRADTTLEALAGLKPAFSETGSVTAGNSSPINDGSSMVLIAAEGAVEGEPLARITGRGVAGNEPQYFGVAPVEAANRALARAGRTWADVDLVELNEAFASQSLACVQLWPDLDPAKLNIDGGALAIGHPLGASGGRIIARAAHALKARGGGVAVVAICIGVGQGLAIVLER
jgi:acetyl-CoA acetyltransferase family protein